MMRLLLPLFIALTFSISAQHQAYLDIGNIKAIVNSNGLLFHNTVTGLGGFEAPKGDSIHSIFSSTIWMSSVDTLANQTIKSSIGHEVYGNQGEIHVGPVDIINQKRDTSSQFQRLWKIDQSTIDFHIANWNQSNYTLPVSIKDWPGNGNASTAKILAPFVDLNGDSIYDPRQGEYPLILGDQAIYVIANNFSNHPIDSFYQYVPDPNNPQLIIDSIFQGISTPLQVEIHMMAYAYSTSEEVSNTIFVKTKLFHRSNSTLFDHKNFKFSTFNDFDIGDPSDDYMGTDTIRNMVYAFNSRSDDIGNNQIKGYSKNLATQGVKFLNSELSGSIEHINPFTGLWGHQKRFVILLQNSRWINGRHLTYGGDGFSYCTDPNKLTNFYFSGNPVLASDSSQWTELNMCSSNPAFNQSNPGDKRIIGTPNLPTMFNHGTNIELDYAFVFAQDTGGVIASVAALQVAADSVQAFYDRNRFVGVNESQNLTALEFSIYPNPATDEVFIKTDHQTFLVEVINLQGQTVQQVQNDRTLYLNQLSNGIYFIRISTEDNVGVKRLVVRK